MIIRKFSTKNPDNIIRKLSIKKKVLEEMKTKKKSNILMFLKIDNTNLNTYVINSFETSGEAS